MQFEEFDKKAKDAADHHHPAYDEQAWGKMEQLLNKHLPQEEDNRRRFLFLLLLFLGLGAAGLLIAKPWGEKKPVAVTKQITPLTEKTVAPSTIETHKEQSKEDKLTTKEKVLTEDSITTTKADQPILTAPGNQQAVKPLSGTVNKKNKTTNTSVLNAGLPKRKHASSSYKTGSDYSIAGNNDIHDKPVSASAIATVPAGKVAPAKDAVQADQKPQQTVAAATTTPPATKVTPSVSKDPPAINAKKEDKPFLRDKTKKEKSKKNNSFFLTFSAGPDVSFVGNDKLGTMKLLGGAGIGYSFNNRVIIRTGFYYGRKVYTASPETYHPPAEFYMYYPYLEKINADCKVYEIPVTVSYNFSRSSKNSFMATAGLSSYLMKKETYDYAFKYYPSGPVYSHRLTIENENKHLFSVLTLSGGYQRSIGQHVSLMVEPYMKLPLSGAGYGKVKLNSGGILLSVGIKPFAAKKEKPAINQ